jgi:putative FmdB family regulatory protein
MPTYEYRCPDGHVFDKFYPTITEKRRLPCPTCGKRAERQISGGAGLVFKGSGFYATDYKRPGDPSASKSETEAADGAKTDGSKPEEAKTDSSSKPTKKDPASDK